MSPVFVVCVGKSGFCRIASTWLCARYINGDNHFAVRDVVAGFFEPCERLLRFCQRLRQGGTYRSQETFSRGRCWHCSDACGLYNCVVGCLVAWSIPCVGRRLGDSACRCAVCSFCMALHCDTLFVGISWCCRHCMLSFLRASSIGRNSFLADRFVFA